MTAGKTAKTTARKPASAPQTRRRKPAQAAAPPEPAGIKVYEVEPGYSILSPKSPRHYKGTYDWPLPEAADLEEFMADVMGPGRYRCELLDADGTCLESIAVSIGTLPQHPAVSAEPDESAINPLLNGSGQDDAGVQQIVQAVLQAQRQAQAMMGQPPQPQRSLIEQLRELKELEALLAPKTPATASPPPAPDPELSVFKLLLNNPESARELSTKLRGFFTGETPVAEESPANAWDFAISLWEGLAPVAQPLLMQLAAKMAQNGAQPVSNPAGPSASAPPSEAAPEPEAAMQLPTMERAYYDAMTLFLDGIAHNNKEAETAQAFLSLTAAFPEAMQYLKPLIYDGAYPVLLRLAGEIPDYKHIFNLPRAETWLAKVQELLRAGLPEPEETGLQAGQEAVAEA